MSEVHEGEVHIDEQEASGGSKEGVVRYVLLISLLAAVLILSIVWITGAVMQDDDDSYVSYTDEVQADADGGEDVDGVLVETGDVSDAGDTQVEDGLETVDN